jgi:hypothetical protein
MTAIEPAILPAPEFVGDEGGDEIDGDHLLALRLTEAGFSHGSHSGEAKLPQRAIEFDEIHEGSPVVRSMRSR